MVTEKAGEKKYLLMSVTAGVGLVPQVEKFGREIAGDSYKNYIVIRKYDFAYNKSATKEFPEGYISMLNQHDIAAVPNSIFTCFRVTDSTSYPPFFDYLFHNNYHGLWLRKYIEVGARAHGSLSIDTKYLWNMPLALPCLEEQQKIADCLSSLDVLIDAESRKLEALKKYKKGLMQKLFPAEEKTLPELRFREFNDSEWHFTRLGRIASVITEKVGENKYLPMSVTSGVGLVPQTEKFGREIAGDSYQNYIVIKKYDFAYNKSATKEFPQGYISMLSQYEIAAVPNSIFTCFRITDNETYPLFFNYLFHNNYHGHWLKKYIEVGARAHGALSIDTKHIWTMPLYLPCSEEQQKIAYCLSKIDSLIMKQESKVTMLKTHKKGLMQGLFPPLEEVD